MVCAISLPTAWALSHNPTDTHGERINGGPDRGGRAYIHRRIFQIFVF